MPSITVSNTTDAQDRNNNGSLQLESKGIADTLNLDDLSASFRSLYKSVFQSSLSGGTVNGNQLGPRKDVMLNGETYLIFACSNYIKSHPKINSDSHIKLSSSLYARNFSKMSLADFL